MRLTLARWITCLAALVPVAAPAQSPLASPAQIHQWIRDHHPALVAGDSGLNSAIVVVDAAGRFVKSVAARLDTNEIAVADRRFAEMRAPASDDSVWSRCGSPPAALERDRPLCLVNGARVSSIDAFQSLAVRRREHLAGPAAVARFGPDAKAGAVSVTTDPAALRRLEALGYAASSVDDVVTMRVRPGILGPDTTYVTVLFLVKPPGL